MTFWNSLCCRSVLRHYGLAERVKYLRMVFKKAVRLFSILVLISVFIYWTITACLKYEQEPISTSTEDRLGDNDLGNFSLPVITFFTVPKFRLPKCQPIHRAKILSEGIIAASISCMQDYENVTAFMEDVHVPNFMKRNIRFFPNGIISTHNYILFLSQSIAILGRNIWDLDHTPLVIRC